MNTTKSLSHGLVSAVAFAALYILGQPLLALLLPIVWYLSREIAQHGIRHTNKIWYKEFFFWEWRQQTWSDLLIPVFICILLYFTIPLLIT